jgi:hypothetical protein
MAQHYVLAKVMKCMHKPLFLKYVRVLKFCFFLQCIVFEIFKKEDHIDGTFEDLSTD